ncbi:centromere protein K [Falco peregrinus]|uniref:centromere protein K n=1 Tax=Falco peregrinus TaxID=8954 RepID=UPI0024788956|nr:centromere protein K [Falco peregrinus]
MLLHVTSPQHSPPSPHPAPGASEVTRWSARRGVRGPAGAERGAIMAEWLSEIIDKDSGCPVNAKTEIVDECESIWTQLEECQRKLMLRRKETLKKSDTRLPLLKMLLTSLTVECKQWQKRSPELISTNPGMLSALGQKELQAVKDNLEMVLAAAESKNKQLEEDLKREQQWHEEQNQLVDFLTKMEEETKAQAELPQKSSDIDELQNEILKVTTFKNKLLIALREFLEEHFPLPKEGVSAKKNSEKPAAELITLHKILEILIEQLMHRPHEPYVTINDSFWPPYVELLLRYGIALRHPEDPNRMRLEAFHI